MRVTLQIWSQIQHTSSSLRCVGCGPVHIQCIYSSAYSGCNIQVNVSALLLELSRQFSERYTANLVRNIADIHPLALCELWSRPNTKNLKLRVSGLQCSAVGNSPVIVDIMTIRCALYCKLDVKYSAHTPVYAV
jgi:hypothetical protein